MYFFRLRVFLFIINNDANSKHQIKFILKNYCKITKIINNKNNQLDYFL